VKCRSALGDSAFKPPKEVTAAIPLLHRLRDLWLHHSCLFIADPSTFGPLFRVGFATGFVIGRNYGEV